MRCPLTFCSDSTTYATLACAYALGFVDRRAYEVLLDDLAADPLTPVAPAPAVPTLTPPLG